MIYIIVEKALIFGDNPNFIIDIIWSGTVIFAPIFKKVIMYSSNDRANANKAPDIIPGNILGRVILKNVFNTLAPRSCAASSSDLSKP